MRKTLPRQLPLAVESVQAVPTRDDEPPRCTASVTTTPAFRSGTRCTFAPSVVSRRRREPEAIDVASERRRDSG